MNRGDLLVFGCGVVFAFYIVEMAERSGRHDAIWFTVIQLAVVVVAVGAVTLWHGGTAAFASGIVPILGRPSFVVQALLLAVVGTAGTYAFQTWAQRHMSATHAAIIYTLEPVVTALLAGWFLAERLGTRGWAGGVLVLAGHRGVRGKAAAVAARAGQAPPLRHRAKDSASGRRGGPWAARGGIAAVASREGR